MIGKEERKGRTQRKTFYSQSDLDLNLIILINIRQQRKERAGEVLVGSFLFVFLFHIDYTVHKPGEYEIRLTNCACEGMEDANNTREIEEWKLQKKIDWWTCQWVGWNFFCDKIK